MSGDIVLIDGNFISDDEVMAKSNYFFTNNNIYISNEYIEVLNNYGIDINNYNNVEELIFDIEAYLNNSSSGLEDLEIISQFLSEYNYYNNTNK